MARYRSLALPSIMTLIGLAVLMSLGKWQLDRREWKLALIERIDARTHAEPVSLSVVKSVWRESRDVEYYPVKLSGRLLSAYERHLYGIVDGKAGWHIITPLETEQGDIIFVDLGLVPDELKDPAKREALEAPISINGLIRGPGEPGWFTPENHPAVNRWFWRDVAGFAASLPEKFRAKALPFMADARELVGMPQLWARGGVTRLELPNRHMEYAITWFGLAATLLVIFLVFARHRLRQERLGEHHAKIADEGGSV